MVPTTSKPGQMWATRPFTMPLKGRQEYMTAVVEIDCKDANDLLDKLSPRGEIFGDTEPGSSRPDPRNVWIFRGHSDDSYLLIPTG
jgi:hypothetical protein